MAKILLIVFIHLISLKVAIAQNISTFRDNIIERKFFDYAMVLMNQDKYAEAITEFNKSKINIDLKGPSYLYSAICWMSLGNKENAIAELSIGFKEGLPISHLKGADVLNPMMAEIKSMYSIVRPQYLSTIDTVLRNELGRMVQADQHIRNIYISERVRKRKDSVWYVMQRVDSINIIRLKEIEKKHGWPGRKIIGNPIFDNGNVVDDVDLIVVHNNEADNIYFLKSAMDKAQRREASWYDASRIMTNLLFRFLHDNVIKLRYTYINEEGRLNFDQSYFQLKMLAKLMIENQHYVLSVGVLRYPGENETEYKKAKKALLEIQSFLLKEGVPSSILHIKEDAILVNEDGFDKCRIGFSRSRKMP